MASDERNAPGESLDRIEYRSLLPIYEQALARHPKDVQALQWLGHALTALGRCEEGLAIDLRLVSLCPRDPTVHYNLACSYALLGRVDESFEALEKAVRLGYVDADHLERDDDLRGIRSDPRFRSILARLRGR